jgi:hypothetical protein
MKKRYRHIAAWSPLIVATMACSAGAAVLTSTTSDRGLRPYGTASGSPARVGYVDHAADDRPGRNAAFAFVLPAAEGPVRSVRLSFWIEDNLADGGYGIDLYGLGVRRSAAMSGADYYAGNDADATDAWLIGDDVVAAQSGRTGWVDVAGGPMFVTYLNAQFAAATPAASNWLVLRLSPGATASATATGISVSLFRGGLERAPRLDLEFGATRDVPVPEPTAGAVLACGGLAMLLGRRRG